MSNPSPPTDNKNYQDQKIKMPTPNHQNNPHDKSNNPIPSDKDKNNYDMD